MSMDIQDGCPYCERPWQGPADSAAHRRCEKAMRDEDAQIKREIDEKVKEQLAEERRAIRAELKEEMEERLELKFEPIKRRNGELEKVLAKRYQRDEDACAAVEARGVMQGKAEASTELRLLRTQLKTANDTMADLNRKMEQRTAQFLGEDGEFDLSATLHESCPTDRIQRVKRGQSGPDVIQHVQENRHVCGAPIVWERKNPRVASTIGSGCRRPLRT